MRDGPPVGCSIRAATGEQHLCDFIIGFLLPSNGKCTAQIAASYIVRKKAGSSFICGKCLPGEASAQARFADGCQFIFLPLANQRVEFGLHAGEQAKKFIIAAPRELHPSGFALLVIQTMPLEIVLPTLFLNLLTQVFQVGGDTRRIITLIRWRRIGIRKQTSSHCDLTSEADRSGKILQHGCVGKKLPLERSLSRLLQDRLLLPGEAILQKAAQGSLKRQFFAYTSMLENFARPVGLARQVAVAGSLFSYPDPPPTDQCDDPACVATYLEHLSQQIKKERGQNDFQRHRLNHQERKAAGMELSRRRYDKLFRLLTRMEAKLHTLIREWKKYELTTISKSSLSTRLSWEAFAADEATACFLAYYVARCNLRSAFTI